VTTFKSLAGWNLFSSTQGARKHLRDAASHLTAGKYADSVRENIHAVEAVGRTLEPSANVLSKALVRLEQTLSIHPAMKRGFESLYAYTSDEGGYGMLFWIMQQRSMKATRFSCSALAPRLFRIF
jgi:hypothetical protein